MAIKCHKRDSGKPAKKVYICQYCHKPIKGPNRRFCPNPCWEIVDREPWDDDVHSGFSAHGQLRAMGAY